MPPEDLEQPSEEDRQMFSDWVSSLKYLSPKDPGPFVIRRLNKTEYGNTLRDLFGVDPSIASELPEEVSGEGYLNSLSPLQLEQYLSIANKVLNEVVPRTRAEVNDRHTELLGAMPSTESAERSSAQKIAKSIGRKAYRRPPTDDEITVLLKVYDLGRNNELSYLQSVRLMLKALLVTPQFLFITPADDLDTSDGIVPLDDYQLASRLSYLLWATMPDEELLSLAEEGKLRDPATLRNQVGRLLMDSRSRALFDGFGAQWLGVGNLQNKTFDPEMFPQMTAAMRSAMYDEVRLVFEYVVRSNRNVNELIVGNKTFLNEDLAKLYGIDSVTGSELQMVTLDDTNRGGVLGMPAVLAATSFPNRTSPVKRGVWVLEQILGDSVPSAPPDVPALESQAAENGAALTLRERTELHRTNQVCANCHKILDPIGFGLENFDAIGRWREKDINGEPIDASGELPGEKRFSTPSELKTIIAERSHDFARNLVEKLLAYALCRRLGGYDEIIVDELMQEISNDGYRMQTLIGAVVTSYPFTHRRIDKE